MRNTRYKVRITFRLTALKMIRYDKICDIICLITYVTEDFPTKWSIQVMLVVVTEVLSEIF